MGDNERVALFVSHANPEDNAFTLWLGAKLAALGYEVWADIFRLKGGEDWQRKLETALRQRARKVLLVGTPSAVGKQGVRNEIQIASDVAKAIQDPEFIIPLRLEAFDAPFLIAHAQYIDFEKGWSQGMTELLETLGGYGVPRTAADGSAIWRDLQLLHARRIVDTPERLLSNWLSIRKLPTRVRMYAFKDGVPTEVAERQVRDAPWPAVPHGQGFLSFAPLHDLQDHFGPSFPLTFVGEHWTTAFLGNGWAKATIDQLTARNHFSNLARQALESLFRKRGLVPFEMSAGQPAWWPPGDTAPDTKVSFRWIDVKGVSAGPICPSPP